MMLAPTTTLGSEMPQANLDDEARQMIEDAGYNADYVAERDSEVDLSNAEPIIDGLPGFNENETQMWIDSARELYATFGPRRAPTRSRQGGKMAFTPAAEPDASAMSDDEIAQWGVELMGSYNYRPEEWLNYFTNADKMTERQKLAFYNLLSGYDKLPDGTWSGTMRMLKGTLTSPSTYLGIGTLGAGFLARQAFKTAGKTGVMNYMRSLMPTAIAAGVEGGLYTGLDDAMRQISAIDAGAQDEFSVGQTAVAAGVGTVLGGGLGLGLPAVGRGAVEGAKLVNRGLDAGVEMMGGGRTLGMGVGPTGDGPRRVGTTGQYVGGPPGLDSPQRLAALRRNMTALAQEGEPGRFWYERSGRAIMDMVGGDRDEAEKIAQAIAITSAGSTPVPSNFDFAMQAYAQYKAGDPIRTGKFPQNMSKQLNEAFYGEGWNGRKTNNFYNNIMREIDPTREQGATIDIHMMRAFGFTNKDGTPYSGTPTDAQYTFVENEVKRIADQLSWEPQQVQAGIWVANKARNLGKAASEMTFDYADAAERNLGQISWESVPGRAGGHLREIFDAPYEQQAEYHVAVSKAFLDDDGNDLIAKRLGLPSPGDFEAPGYFEGKVSPGTQTEIIAPRQYQSKQVGQIEPATEDLINAYAAARGILMKQDGVGWHRPFYKSLKREANGYEINLGRPLSEDETMRVAQAIEGIVGHGEYAPIAAPKGVRIINFDYLEVDNVEFVKIIQQALDVIDFDENAEYVGKTFHAYAGYAGNDWKENPNGEGYYNSRWAGRPDLQGRVRDVIAEIGPRIDEVDLDFSERYGWTRNEALNAGYRNPAEVSDTNATQ